MVTAYLLYNGQRVTLCSKLKLLSVGEAKASLNRASSYME